MIYEEESKKLSLEILAFQQSLSNVMQIMAGEGKPGEAVPFKKKIPATLDFKGWRPGCDKCITLTKFEKEGDFYLIEGHTNIPQLAELNPAKGAIATKINKTFELYIGDHYNNPYYKVEGDPTNKLELNPLYRYIEFSVLTDVDLT